MSDFLSNIAITAVSVPLKEWLHELQNAIIHVSTANTLHQYQQPIPTANTIQHYQCFGIYVVQKVQIRRICGLSCATMGLSFGATNLLIVRVLANTWLGGFTCMLVKQWRIVRNSVLDKTSSFPQRSRARCQKGTGNEVLLSEAIPAMDVLSALSMLSNIILVINPDTIFNGYDSTLHFLVCFRRTSFNPHFAHLLRGRP